MRSIGKSHKLDNVCYDIRGPVLDKATAMEAEGIKLIKLNIGNPAPFGFRAPEPVLRAMEQALPIAEGYSASRGIPEAVESALGYCRMKGIQGISEADIYMGNGVSELIMMCMQALLDNGDEMLIPAPDYPLWTAAVTLAGGTARHYICDEQSEWLPDLKDMESKITPRTKGIVIINPNNPTGAVYPVTVLEQIAELARRHSLIIFADEIYDRLCMDGVKQVSIASLAPDVPCITMNGLSKSHLIAGYRVGFMCISGPHSLMKGYVEGVNMLSSMRLCSNVPAQHVMKAAMGCLDSTKELLVPGGRIYDQREIICNRLSQMEGVSFVKPKAAFYMFPRFDTERFHIENDLEFIQDLLEREHVLLVQGTGFNWPAPDHARIVYLPCAEDLNRAMDRMEHWLAHRASGWHAR